MEDIQQLYKNQLTQVNQLYQNRLEDIITTMKNAAMQSDSQSASQQAESIKQALFNERESAIQRFMSENAQLKAEYYKEQQDRARFQQLYQERDKKYLKLKKAFQDQKQIIERQNQTNSQQSDKYKDKYVQLKQDFDELKSKISSQKQYSFGQTFTELEVDKRIKIATEKTDSEHQLKIQQIQNEWQMRLNQQLFESDQKIQKYKISAEKKISQLQNEINTHKSIIEAKKQSINEDIRSTDSLEQNNTKLQQQLEQHKNDLIIAQEKSSKLEIENKNLQLKSDQSKQNIAVITHKYAQMQNELDRIKDTLKEVKKLTEIKFLMSNQEISYLLAKVYKFLDYNSLRNHISENLEIYTKSREEEIRKQFLDMIADVQGAVDELK